MSDKKRIQEQEWSILDHFAEDVNTSLSKVYDVLREGRILRKQDLMNRSWFMGFMRAICGCVDGKMKGYRRPKNTEKPVEVLVNTEKPVEEQVNVEKPVEEQVENIVPESMTELLSKEALFVLRWMYHNNQNDFVSMLKAGYSKSKVLRSTKELLELSIITKKNPRRFDPFNWEQIKKDFPEVMQRYSPEDEEDMRIVHRKKEVVESKEVEVNKEQKPQKKKMTDMQKAVDWLLHEEHASGEFTKPELINFLRRIHVSDSYGEADKLIFYWCQQNAISVVPGTYAYKILPMAKLLLFAAPEETKEQPTQKIALAKTEGKDLVIRCDGKDIRVVNKSNSNLSITIENGSVILTIS